jgi:hypothetical protein
MAYRLQRSLGQKGMPRRDGKSLDFAVLPDYGIENYGALNLLTQGFCGVGWRAIGDAEGGLVLLRAEGTAIGKTGKMNS